MSPLLRALGALSALELISVLVLLGNLATVHDPAVTRILGPLHGALYLTVAVTAMLGRGLAMRTRIGALVPVLSGPLTMVNVRREVRTA
ncbi:hypothetical protein HZU40_20000 [Mycolicibacterium fluoranthenivorans]|jgi:hypothetical protein|uniref:DUF3817 domain-containing protein n=1 Tax=Mycolicibacterium fluoranthenivorans TaxID=258505 RepID=A0A1G4WAE7_9MYCO|nr:MULTISPECIES: hypothetical protein [Mycobacteriaceae]MCV7256297.1 hypothetical protein [Mycobacterium hackensackense]QNJ90544.1 hypothetical protein HZU40_20000 [Mycolicibacterium fluoranthenivorans]SCX19445.1 hypothetical protein SAMN02799620_02689 [Mycolicibacterium fluoranthenivorans]